MERQDSPSNLSDTSWQKLSPSVLTQVNGTPNDRASKEDDVYLARINKRFKPKYSAHITVLEQAITASVAGTLSAELGQQAKAEAHLLIGALASFGFAEASRISREIEQIFRAGVEQSQAQVERLELLVVALRQEVEV